MANDTAREGPLSSEELEGDRRGGGVFLDKDETGGHTAPASEEDDASSSGEEDRSEIPTAMPPPD